MSRYRVALIGLGRIASTIDDEVQGYSAVMLPYAHMACYREVPGVEVVAGADSYAEQRVAFQERWGVRCLYSDYHEMLLTGQLQVDPLITHRFPAERAAEAFALLDQHLDQALGVLLKWPQPDDAGEEVT